MSRMTRVRVLLGVALLALAGASGAGGKTTDAPKGEGWKEVERLVSEQKLEAASQTVAKLREQARRAGDDEAWAKALVRETELRIALGGYETAVRFLKDQPWPKAALWRAALQLYYGHALVTYSDMYGWEIGQRERIATSEVVDLKAWTQEQIFTAAVAAYGEAWQAREALGREPVKRFADVIDPNNYPPEIRGTALGMAAGVGRVGAIVGPAVGGALLTAGIAYPWGFYAFAAAALLAVLALSTVPADLEPDRTVEQ